MGRSYGGKREGDAGKVVGDERGAPFIGNHP